MAQQLSVKITSPNQIIWQGNADSVSSVNSQGPFDILAYHANFICIVEEHPIIVVNGANIKAYNFKRAIIYTYENSVQIFTDI